MSQTTTKFLNVPAAYGEAPEGWLWGRLDDLSDGVFDCPHSTPKLTSTGAFVVRTQDIITGIFRADRAAHVSDETYEERTARVVPKRGDLLYSREGTYFGIAAEVPENTRICLGQRMVLIRPDNERLDFRFLRYWLNSPIMAAHIHGYRDGTVAERLNLPTIRGLPIAVPPLSEQQAIALVLGALDDKIELNRRMNETLEALAQNVFKSRFVDVTQHALPKDWREGTVEELCQTVENGGTPKRMESDYWNGTISWLKTGELKDGPVIDSEEKISDAGLANSACRLWHEGTILIALYASPTVGRLGILEIKATANQACSALVAKQEYGNLFVFYSLLFARDRLQQIAVGAAQQNINQQVLRKHRIVIPPSVLVRKFHEQVLPLYQRRVANVRESRTLAALRDTLLPKLLSGELRVPPNND